MPFSSITGQGFVYSGVNTKLKVRQVFGYEEGVIWLLTLTLDI